MQTGSVQIFYDGKNVASGFPTPLVSRSDSPVVAGEKYGVSENIVLQGQINACSFQDFIEKQSYLHNVFSKDYQTLEIKQDGLTIEEKPLVRLDSIDFPQDRYVGIINYSVSLSSFPSGTFRDYYGVESPSNEWSIKENDDQTLSLTHTVSAKGFNTSPLRNNALNNAKSFVHSRTGVPVLGVKPFFLCQTIMNPTLNSFREAINRFDGSYSITEEYTADALSSGEGILRYTVDFDIAEGQFLNATLNGGVEGSFYSDFGKIRNRYQEFRKYDEVYSLYTGMGLEEMGVLSRKPLLSGVTEDPLGKTLSFNISFNNNPFLDSYVIDYESTIESGNSFVEVSVNGTITSQDSLKQRFETAKDIINSTGFSPYQLALNDYFSYFGNTLYPLNPLAVSSGVTENKFDGTIAFYARYNNRDPIPSGLETLSYSLDITPPFRKIATSEILDGTGKYDFVDLGYYNRASLTMQGNAIKKSEVSFANALEEIYKLGNFTLQGFGGSNRVIVDKNIETGSENQLSFTFQWTLDSDSVVNIDPDFDTVINLEI